MTRLHLLEVGEDLFLGGLIDLGLHEADLRLLRFTLTLQLDGECFERLNRLIILLLLSIELFLKLANLALKPLNRGVLFRCHLIPPLLLLGQLLLNLLHVAVVIIDGASGEVSGGRWTDFREGFICRYGSLVK